VHTLQSGILHSGAAGEPFSGLVAALWQRLTVKNIDIELGKFLPVCTDDVGVYVFGMHF
jgi:hypothetical protein